MSEYTEVEQAFLSQLTVQGWTVIDQGSGCRRTGGRACDRALDTDGGTRLKVMCRYQQFRGANRILDRLREGTTALVGASTHFLTHGDFAG